MKSELYFNSKWKEFTLFQFCERASCINENTFFGEVSTRTHGLFTAHFIFERTFSINLYTFFDLYSSCVCVLLFVDFHFVDTLCYFKVQKLRHYLLRDYLEKLIHTNSTDPLFTVCVLRKI